MEEFHAEIVNIAVMVLVLCASFVTKRLTSFLKKKGYLTQLENNRETVRLIVIATEQMYKKYNGQEKFALAKLEITKLVQQKKIKMTEDDINIMIEAIVKEMKETYKENK